MKRWLLTILLFLLLGAVVNVAVAWGCALWLEDRYALGRPQEYASRVTDNASFSVLRSHKLGITNTLVMWEVDSNYWNNIEQELRDRGPEPSTLLPQWFDLPPLMDEGVSVYVFERGWPLASMYWIGYGGSPVDGRFIKDVRGGLPTGRWYRGPMSEVGAQHLPLFVVWPRSIANTFFYAVLLWLPICGPFALRRHIRKSHGRCLKCGYPVGASGVCTECGTTL